MPIFRSYLFQPTTQPGINTILVTNAFNKPLSHLPLLWLGSSSFELFHVSFKPYFRPDMYTSPKPRLLLRDQPSLCLGPAALD